MQWISEVPKPEYNGKRVVVREDETPYVRYYIGVIVGNIVVYEGAIVGDPEYGAPIHNIVAGIDAPQDDDNTVITDFDGTTFTMHERWNASGSVHPYTYTKRLYHISQSRRDIYTTGIVINYSYALLD